MSKYWSDFVRTLEPYVPGEQTQNNDFVKLNTNENPYGPSPRVFEAIKSLLNDDFRLYPPPNSDYLKEVIADHYSLKTNQVFVGNGSDEVLAHVFNGLFRKQLPIFFPDITYSFYPVFCRLYGIAYKPISLTTDFILQLDDYKYPNGGIIFPNPNAPTGRLLEIGLIEELLEENTDSVVVIDEAYIDFGGVSCATLIPHYDNLLVVRTLSKSHSLAGLRIGYAIGSFALVDGLNRIKNSFNSYPLSNLQVTAALASFADHEYFESTRQKVIASRKSLTEALQLLGFEVLPSAANFVFAAHPKKNAEHLFRQLYDKKILVRHFDRKKIEQFLRITVGTELQHEILLRVMSDILKSP